MVKIGEEQDGLMHYELGVYLGTSVSARPRHCGNPALHSEKAPRKMEKGPI